MVVLSVLRPSTRPPPPRPPTSPPSPHAPASSAGWTATAIPLFQGFTQTGLAMEKKIDTICRLCVLTVSADV